MVVTRPSFATASRAVGKSPDPGGQEMIWFLVLLLLLLAVGGGIFLSKFLFIVLVVVLLVALFGRRSRV
jgi:hypothetical protein